MQEIEDYDLEAMAYEAAVIEEINAKNKIEQQLYYGDDDGRAE